MISLKETRQVGMAGALVGVLAVLHVQAIAPTWPLAFAMSLGIGGGYWVGRMPNSLSNNYLRLLGYSNIVLGLVSPLIGILIGAFTLALVADRGTSSRLIWEYFCLGVLGILISGGAIFFQL